MYPVLSIEKALYDESTFKLCKRTLKSLQKISEQKSTEKRVKTRIYFTIRLLLGIDSQVMQYELSIAIQ